MRDGVMQGASSRACPDCVARRRRSLGADAGPADAMLAAPDCACQTLTLAEQRARLLTPGAGPLASIETRHVSDLGLWVAVARGADARQFGAVADLALGLGIDATQAGARLCALGEVLERYGAAVVPPGVGGSVPVFDANGRHAGRVDPARVWLPFHRAGRPVLPASSDGLGFGFDRTLAMSAAAREWVERRALHGLAASRLAGAARPLAGAMALSARAFAIAAPLPVCLVLIPAPEGRRAPPIAAGAACRGSLPDACRAALREAVLGWLIATGAVLPGAGLQATELLGPLAALPLSAWPNTVHTAAGSPFSLDGLSYADLTPADIGRAGGHVLRALVPE